MTDRQAFLFDPLLVAGLELAAVFREQEFQVDGFGVLGGNGLLPHIQRRMDDPADGARIVRGDVGEELGQRIALLAERLHGFQVESHDISPVYWG